METARQIGTLFDTEKKTEENLVNLSLFFSFSVSIPMCVKRVNGGYFPAICRLGLSLLKFFDMLWVRFRVVVMRFS